MTQTIFIPYTTKAVTATVTGDVVLWDYPISELVQSSGRDAIKILKYPYLTCFVRSVFQSASVCPFLTLGYTPHARLVKSGINLLDTVMDRYVVCGCLDGGVRFFDFQFRVVAWFEDIKAGQVPPSCLLVTSAASPQAFTFYRFG